MIIQGRKVCIIVPSREARGTSKIVRDYKAYFELLGACVELKSPPQTWPRWRILAWELLGMYLDSCGKEDLLLSPNGRISPRVFLGGKRLYMIVLLDTMNVGFNRLMSREYRLIEKINILINSVIVSPSIRSSQYVTAISKKTARDFESYLGWDRIGRDDMSSRFKGIVVYPGGSFREQILDGSQGPKEKRSGGIGAIWISGETRNKGFLEGVGLLERLSSALGITEVSVYGIRSARLREKAERHHLDREFSLRFSPVNSREKGLVQCYLESQLALCLSKEEGYGIPFLDALLMGMPVIATRIETYLEIMVLVGELIDTVPPVLWIEDILKRELVVSSDSVKRFDIQTKKYILPSKSDRIARYKELNSRIATRSRNDLADYLCR